MANKKLPAENQTLKNVIYILRQHRANGLLSRKSIPTMNHDRDTPLKCLHVRTDSSRQTWSVSQNQIRKCE